MGMNRICMPRPGRSTAGLPPPTQLATWKAAVMDTKRKRPASRRANRSRLIAGTDHSPLLAERIEHVAIDQVQAYQGNPRDHDDRQIAKLAGVENFEPKIAGRRWKLDEDLEDVADVEEQSGSNP